MNPLNIDKEIEEECSFESSKIIQLYHDIGFDVSRFFKNIDEVKLYKCKESGYRYYYPFTCIGDAEFYQELSKNRKSYYSIRWEHLKAQSILKKTDKVLEIGSGFGAFLKLLNSKGIYSEGIELNQDALKKCKQQGLIIHDQLIDEFVIENTDKYDAVCYFQVLEHITGVYDFINDSLKSLKSGGKLLIGVPNNNPYLFVSDKYHTLNLPPHHAGLWNEKSLKSLQEIFPIKLNEIHFEPLSESYNVFLKAYIKNSKFFIRNLVKFSNKVFPKLLKLILCKLIKGRNILIVYKKI